MPDNSGNDSRSLAPIFLANTSRRSIENAPAPTRASRDSLHRVMGIEDHDDSDNQLSDLDYDNESNFVYHNSEDEARFDPKAAANNEENENKIESESHSDLEVEAIVAQPAGRRQVRSDIYTHISVISIDGCEYFKCNTCLQQYKRSAGTKNICDHLLKQHAWSSLTGVQQKHKREHESIKDVVRRMGPAAQERRDAIRKELLREHLDKDTLEYLFVQTVILCDLPFSLVQNHFFCTWLEYVNSVANELLPNSGTTIRPRIMSLYQEGQRRICLVLQDALSSIHISCDGCIAPNSLGIFGIVGHFTDEEGTLQALLLALVEIKGVHSGEQLATHMLTVLDEYHIRDRLGYFVMDNATANDPMVSAISDQLLETDRVNYNAQQHRLRCNGHIINLSVRAFLFGSLPEDIPENDEEGPTTAELQRWRKMGPLGKLHNIVVYIKASSQRTQVFMRISQGKMVRQDNGTRWDSWYEMLD